MPLSAAERSLRARLAAQSRWSRESPHGPDSTPAKARAGLERRFYEGIPEDLPPAERDRRAASARKAYFTRLALASAKARRAREAARRAPSTPDSETA